MDHITEAFYNVMYQYKLAFTPDGVQANLNQRRQQKTPLLELLRRHPLGARAARVGTVETEHPGWVGLHTPIGGVRLLDMPTGELLPRIC